MLNAPSAKSDGPSNVKFFQALGVFMDTLKNSPLPDTVVQQLLVAWIRGYDAGQKDAKS